MTRATIDIQAFINEHPFTRYQWMIFVLCFITVTMDGFDTATIGFTVSDLAQEWDVKKSALGLVTSAVLVGLAVGTLTAGPLADRIGRKKVLIMSITAFNGLSLLTAFATSLGQLTLLRFLTGLGFDVVMPNAATLMSEYAPEHRRALPVNLMLVGFPMGLSLGGFLSTWMIPHHDWQSALVLGGVMLLLPTVALIFLLPELTRYLVARQQPAQRIVAILERIIPLPEAVEPELCEVGQMKKKSAIGAIFPPRYAVSTVTLCLTYFVGLLVFYLPTGWLPLLIRETSTSVSRTSIITALSPLGDGIGVLILGVLVDKIDLNRVVAVGWLLTGVCVCPVGFPTSNLVLMGMMVLIADSIMNDAQSSMPALAAGFYPTQGYATGVAWMLGIGRLGGILGAFGGALLMQAQLSLETIFTLLATPTFLSALALLTKCQVSKFASAAKDDVRGLQKV